MRIKWAKICQLPIGKRLVYGDSHVSWCGCYIVGRVNRSHEEAAPVDDFSENKWDSDGAGRQSMSGRWGSDISLKHIKFQMHIGPRNWNTHFFDLQDESHYQELDTVDPYISQLFLTRKRATMDLCHPLTNIWKTCNLNWLGFSRKVNRYIVYCI